MDTNEHPWPLRRTPPEDFEFFTKAEVLEFLAYFDDETPIWIDNYWQPVRQIAQRPLEVIGSHPDGIHFG
ncbi:hypothetical protein FHE66_14705 [Georgenia sp. 311]|uniref:hypothetical protein n=1 Tax=Georgenia sp. 311 TaxID=2585134 RepID=UPI00111261CE|nr:hypothetical protein [Georgenia sp. 311]TNC16623.1 hypothetical protein FHE66_14705 [Georgenia sp. 311]